MTQLVRLEAVIRGRVQGVGYRYFAWAEGRALDLQGWVANESDGTVHCVAEGSRDDLEALLGRLEAGPAGAIVEAVTVTWGDASGSLGPFGIRSGGHRGD